MSKAKSAIDRLLPPKIGSDGRLLEWVSTFNTRTQCPLQHKDYAYVVCTIDKVFW